MALSDWPARERPREKLLERGAGALSEAELLALVLRVGRPGHNAVDLARAVLAQFRSLRMLLTADAKSFCRQSGLGIARYAELQAALELARRHYQEILEAGPGLTSPRATRDFLVARLRDRPYEVFCCLHLDNRHRLLAFEELFRGTIDGASVHPREVVRQVLARNAAAVIIAHNAPLGRKPLTDNVNDKLGGYPYPHRYPKKPKTAFGQRAFRFGYRVQANSLTRNKLSAISFGSWTDSGRRVQSCLSVLERVELRTNEQGGTVMPNPTKALIVLALVLIAGCGVRAKTQVNHSARIYSAHNESVCLLAGTPPSEVRYEVLGRVVATKRTYGSQDELFAPMVREARKLGADALINLQAGQRFKGPLPWRITSPTGQGTAIKVLPGSTLDCVQAGGKTFGTQGEIQASAQPDNQPSPESNKYADLERLKRLLDQGAITQAEYDREKAKLLN